MSLHKTALNHDVFEALFPGAAQQLQMLRAKDAEFNSMCDDYLDVFAELAGVTGTGCDARPRYVADLAESLSDLHGEIELRLQAAVPQAQQPQGNR